MRTKTLLLTAAVCAAGVASSMAQVYSVNIVGYVQNVPTVAPSFSMLNNPLDNGTNTLTSLFAGIPGGSSVQTWNGAGFDLYTFSAGNWKKGVANANSFQIPPGRGFFMKAGAAYTNVFVGNVVANPGTSVTNSVGLGFQLIGALVPYAGAVTNTADVNLIVPGGTGLQKWNVGTQGYDAYTFSAGQWKKGVVSSVPSIGIGEGFFLNNNSGSPINWKQSVP